MSYPINEIYEGVAELLLKHGKHIFLSYTQELLMTDNYVKYGERIYKIRYVAGELCDIYRLPSNSPKEVNNGKDQR